jgi:hypothetical protein
MGVHGTSQRYRLCLVSLRFLGYLFIDLSLGLQPMPQGSAIKGALALPKLERSCPDLILAICGHGNHLSPKNDRTAMTMTTSPTM